MSSGAMTLLDAALGYAALGWAVFPLGVRSKLPLIARECGGRGCLDASRDEGTIRRWWHDCAGANIGIATGSISNLWVLDLDPRHGGDVSFADLGREHGGVGETVLSRTGGGGWHIYFGGAPRIRNSVGKIAPGIDVRSDGGYVIGPPSVHPNGDCYRWHPGHGPEEVAVGHAPLWLLLAAQQAGGSGSAGGGVASPERHRDLFAAGAAQGSRNAAVAQLTGYLLRRGVDPLMVLDVLRLWNVTRCRPPLDDDELTGVVASICKREARKCR
jgi:hypothetical protein